ncbi:TerB N-terminal domain-containing protein [Paenibacillus sp. FA6]|uniref:TerB N-terminal domain-containing protein n=1 Tax=Paenibacillus sp. FA6 TaxID=3413029 RepID=UPI003F65D372
MNDNREDEQLTDIHPTYHEAELVLEGYTEVNNGVGQAYAIPVLTVGSQRIQAAEVSRSIKPDRSLVPVIGGYVAVDTLRQAGVGPMGRTIHGALLDRRYQLTPSEVIARGSERMQGAWSRIVFPDLVWPCGGDSPIYEHLQFLAKWGLNGGVRGGALHHAEQLQLFMNDMVKNDPETRILVIGKKTLLDKLKESWRTLDAMWLTVGGKDQIIQEILLSGVIISTPSVAKQQQVERLSFDMILMLEPDDLTKSSTTQIYKQLKKMKSRLKLAIYSEADYIAQSYVSTAHMNLLKINDYTVAQYVIYNPNQPRKELPRPYRRMERPSIVQEESVSLHITEMELVEERTEKGMPIPQREASFQLEPRRVPVQAPISSIELTPLQGVLSKNEHRFTKRARQLEDQVGTAAVFVPFMNYWPTYDSMTGSQSRWYFYWRSEVREQRYPDSSLSYIFLYVYELINGIGWKDPRDGYQLMVDVWLAYREHHPKLTTYMLEWITDFTLVHQIPIPHQDVFQYVPNELSGDVLELELMHRFNTEPLDIPFSLLVRLADVDVRKSKFYIGGGDVPLNEYVPKVLALVDAYLAKQQGLRLIEIFYPGSPVGKERPLFQSATYDESLYGRSTVVSVTKLSQHAPLREYITHLIRLTENKLREHMNFKGRLRGIELEPEIETLVSRYIDRMLKVTTSPEALGPVVVIDEEKLVRIQRDSEFVRDILTVNIDEGEEQVEEQVRLRVAQNLDNEVEHVPEQQEDSLLQLNIGDEVGVESILSPLVTWDVTGLAEEWIQFADALSVTQLEALYILKQGQGLSGLLDIANEVGTMPELLLDDINELAMDTIGDLVIDDDGLTEDYVPMLANLKRRVKR